MPPQVKARQDAVVTRAVHGRERRSRGREERMAWRSASLKVVLRVGGDGEDAGGCGEDMLETSSCVGELLEISLCLGLRFHTRAYYAVEYKSGIVL